MQIVDEKGAVSYTPLFGCTACGYCMAICPSDAIEISGRELSPDDLFVLPQKDSAASYEQLLSLMNLRRSIREFKEKPVEKELIDKIFTCAVTAPMGIPLQT